MIRISKNMGLNIPLKDLMQYSKTCKIEMDSKRHFESYSGILIYATHPDSNEKFTIQLGVDEDGIVYEGDYGCLDSFEEISIHEGMEILMKYRELIHTRNGLERLLRRNKIDTDMIALNFK